MPYQTGTASSAADLQSTIKTFAAAQGWTVSSDVIYKGSIYAELTVSEHGSSTEGDTLNIQGGTGQSGGSLTGASTYTSAMRNRSNLGDLDNNYPVTYHLFAHTSPDQISCFINYNGDWYQWLTFGELDKYGSYTGGQFYAAISPYAADSQNTSVKISSNKASYAGCPSCTALFWGGGDDAGSSAHDGSVIHVELDSQIWWTSSTITEYDSNRVNTPAYMHPLVNYSVPVWNEMAVLLPYYVFANRPSSKSSLLGQVAHWRIVRIDNYEAGDIITIGSDEYKVFPWVRKSAETVGTNESGVWGVAVVYDGP